ncbi:MAG: alpha/beta hydrolase, partial [Hyphomicrobiaceae bacterium]
AQTHRIVKAENTRLQGDAFARLRRLSYAQCERYCLADRRCKALEFYPGEAGRRRSYNCALFSNVRAAVRARHVLAGYKRSVVALGPPPPLPRTKSVGKENESFGAAGTGSGGGGGGDGSIGARKPTSPSRSIGGGHAYRKPPSSGFGSGEGGARPPRPRAVVPPPAPAPTPGTREGDFGTTRSLTVPPSPAPSASAQAKATDDKGYHVVPVFYGTDRNRKDTDKRIAYGSDRARRLEMGEALVTVPLSHKVPNIERPSAWTLPWFGTIWQGSEDPKKHFTVKEIRALKKGDLLALVKERLKASKTFQDQSIVFIHGYNMGFDDSLYRTAQITYDLQFDGAAFTYSWPSGAGWTSYPYDRDSAQQAEPYLYEFLQMVQKETGTKSINIIAHSMGNQILLQVLRDLKRQGPATSNINQIILAAPDVDRDAFEFLASQIKGVAKGITLYASSNDKALEASRIFAGNKPRAGDVPSPPETPVIVPGIDTIDISSVSTSYLALNHSSYAENTELLTDLKRLIRTGIRPPNLRLKDYHQVLVGNGAYWRYGN